MKIRISETVEKGTHSILESVDHYLKEGLHASMESNTFVNICDDKNQILFALALPKEGKRYASIVSELGPDESSLPSFDLEVPDQYLKDFDEIQAKEEAEEPISVKLAGMLANAKESKDAGLMEKLYETPVKLNPELEETLVNIPTKIPQEKKGFFKRLFGG